MGYSAQVIARAQQRLAEQKADKESRYRAALMQAYAREPRLREIDAQLRRTMTLAAKTAFMDGTDAREAMAAAREANLALQAERQQLIDTRLPGNFLDETPICDRCSGNGYLGSRMCGCLSCLCVEEQKKEIAMLTTGQETFERFRLDYYPERVDPMYGASPRAIMERNFKYCCQYAQNFAEGIGNLLFVGGTGLGKTYLSACIANAVTDKGFSVAYESAPNLFSKLEKARFEHDEESHAEVAALKTCDLLIIDDLGTEMPGSFVTAALYSLLNDRLLAGKCMLISTNLNVDEMAKRYSPQIASRVQGQFRGLTFVGQDIRVLKSRGV